MKRTLLVIALASATQLAVAQPPVDKPLGKKEFAEGKGLYASGDYFGAATHFVNAYKADPDPAYIFNVGQAYRRRAEAKAGELTENCALSMQAYKKFLEHLPQAPNKAEVEAYIKDMTTCAGGRTIEPLPWVHVEKPPVDKPPIDKPPIDKPPIDKPPIDKPSGGSGSKQWIGIGMAGAGVVGLVVGVFGVKLAGEMSDKSQALADLVDSQPGGATPAQNAESKSIDKRGGKADTKVIVGFSVGGALVVGGAALFILGGKSKEQKLTVAPSKDGAMVLGTFRF